MASPRSRQSARLRARRRRSQQRARALVVLALVGAIAVVTLLVTAFDPGGSASNEPALETTAASTLTGRPTRQVLATVGNLKLELPIGQPAVTAIGFHGANDGALAIQPVGRQANEGLLARLWRKIAGASTDGPVWYQLEGGPGSEVLDVGAPPGTDVYAPVDGVVVGVSDVVVGGTTIGSRIDMRPSQSPSVVVSVSNVEVDPAIAVGSQVLAASSKLGTAAHIAAVERQALAAHTQGDGNNIAVAVYPSAGS